MRSVRPLLIFAVTLGLAVASVDGLRANTPASPWFTVHGDATAPDRDTVQVDPVARNLEPRTMAVRVNRATPRISWDGVPYRSFAADVAFDCGAGKAQYLRVAYFLDPLWQGSPVREVDYASGPPRMMEFREIEPNPTQRIVSAACPPKR